MGKIISTIIGLCLVCLITYGMYWLFKTISYEIFYENMVQETIREMVKPEYLNKI